MMPDSKESQLPLVIDLDGTLIFSDLLWESIVLFLKNHILQIWQLPLWLLLGKAGFKERLASVVQLDAAALPYDHVLISEIKAQRAQGRITVLATGASQHFASLVASHLQLFDQVHASDPSRNLTSTNKAAELVRLYGDKGFDYIGNSRVDIPVWQNSRVAYSVTHKPFQLSNGRETLQIGSKRVGWVLALLKAIRPRQWIKNLLVFVPMLTAHQISEAAAMQSALAFLAFSMCASSAYLLNDALDAQEDRLHSSKCRRPIADGSLPLPIALLGSVVLALAALLLCAVNDPLLLVVVSLYFVSTLTYSLVLKRLLMVDVVTLAILYSLRILGGSASTHIEPSFWLLGFSFFVFLSLALLKRNSELIKLHRQGKEKPLGRGYITADKIPIGIIGINSGFLSVLIFILYFNSENVLKLYPHPAYLIGIVPMLVFWLGHLWTLSFRGEVGEDPVLHVSNDPISLIVIGTCVALAVAASF